MLRVIAAEYWCLPKLGELLYYVIAHSAITGILQTESAALLGGETQTTKEWQVP